MVFKSAGPNDQWQRILKAMVHVLQSSLLLFWGSCSEVPEDWNRVQCPILLKGWSWKIVDLLA